VRSAVNRHDRDVPAAKSKAGMPGGPQGIPICPRAADTLDDSDSMERRIIMDSNRFDSLVRHISTGSTRRAAVKSLTAVGLGLGLTRLGLGQADAKKKKKRKSLGQTCKKSKQCKGSLVCQITDEVPDPDQICRDVPAAKRCCVKLGERCDHGCDCCGTNVICNGHICETA
jgi:hypothetical protein